MLKAHVETCLYIAPARQRVGCEALLGVVIWRFCGPQKTRMKPILGHRDDNNPEGRLTSPLCLTISRHSLSLGRPGGGRMASGRTGGLAARPDGRTAGRPSDPMTTGKATAERPDGRTAGRAARWLGGRATDRAFGRPGGRVAGRPGGQTARRPSDQTA